MNTPQSHDQPIHDPPAGASKKPYQKPAFRHEKVFETMALTCGKVNGTQSTCMGLSRKNS